MAARPEIIITTDSASTDNLHSVEQRPTDDRRPSDPTLLSPSSLSPSSLSPILRPHILPRLTILTPDDDIHTNAYDETNLAIVPPSPTLSSRSSVHFAPTTLELRNNVPDATSGLSSLALLGSPPRHRRKASNASSLGSGTIADHGDVLSLHPMYGAGKGGESDAGSTLHSPTHTYVDTLSPAASHDCLHKSRRSSSAPDPEDDSPGGPVRAASSFGPDDDDAPSKPLPVPHGTTAPAPDPTRDPAPPAQTEAREDLGPFSFAPYCLAALVDPKSLDTLGQMGGETGLLHGLGTDGTRGLSRRALVKGKGRASAAGSPIIPGVGRTASPVLRSSSPVPRTSVTVPHGEEADMAGGQPSAYDAPLAERRRVYGENLLPQRPRKSLLQLMWLALKDKVLVILSIAAIVSLALGLFQDFGAPRAPDDPPVDWVEGVAIMVAIFIVVMVGSLNDWQKEKQFQRLNERKEERGVKVMRDGEERVVDVKDVVVGDIALLEPGEVIPCDGVFLAGHNVKCDESSATGESDAIRKLPYAECHRLAAGAAPARNEGEGGRHSHEHTDCFMVSGSKVLEGTGRYVVIAVGQKSFHGRIMMALRGDVENTPLQMKLNNLAELIAKLGSLAGTALFAALMIRFFVQLGTGTPARTSSEKGIAFVQILIISVTLIVVAVPEGLPLAVTLALAFATKRMTRENLLVRVLGSCETMANASVICTDKTGTLTQNAMTVVAGSVGVHGKFVRHLADNEMRTNANEEAGGRSASAGPSTVGTARQQRRHAEDFSFDQTERMNDVLGPRLVGLFNEAIAVNSTAFEETNEENGERVFVGSKTETALLAFAQELGWAEYRHVRPGAEVVQMIPFSSERKAMGVVVRRPDGGYRFHVKGASEILTKRCVRHIVVREAGPDAPERNSGETVAEHEVETCEIDEMASENISRTIIFYANQTLRTIALCYRDFDVWPPDGMTVTEDEEVEVAFEDLAQELTLIAITGIEDPLREGVRDAVAKCHKAGVTVKMCTGDNVLTARSIALQCGIYSAGGIIMEGPVFRQLDDREMLEVVPRLQVLARSSPEDKKILVSKLRELGEIVGVTGDGTNDGPALKSANVGFSMGVAGTEVAKEASDIILMDDNFSSIVKAIMWGRCVNDSVRKFLQFQVSVNITAVIITFVSAVASASESSVLSAVQLLWVNIIMDTFAALALATDKATESLLDRQPERANAPLFSVDMYKQIFGQAAYQSVIALVFHFLGFYILGLSEHSSDNDGIVQTLVFNIFVFSQIFNSVNSRRLDKKLNVFEGITKNWYFVSITLIEIVFQVLIVFVGGAAFTVKRINGAEWGISLALGFVSLPLGAVIRLLPNKPFERLFIWTRLLPNPEILPTSRFDHEGEWNAAIERIRDNLGTFANVRGGRLRSSSFVVKSRKTLLDDQPRVPLSSLMTMVPTLVASSVGAGWAPQPGSLSDPATADPSKSTAALWEGKIQVHPDTRKDDFAYKKWGAGDASTSAQSAT